MNLNQVTLPVRDYEEAVRFYTKLGFTQIVGTEHGYARFEIAGGATLSIHTDPAMTPETGALLYFEVEALDATVDHLIEKGVHFDSLPEDKPWRWREARLRDPTGNRLCLYWAGTDRRFPPWRLDGRRAD